MKKWMALMLGMALLSGGVAVTLRLRREPMSNRAPNLPEGIPPEFAALLSAPIPAVDPEDMRRIWPLFEFLEEEKGEGATGIDVRLLAEHCSAGANVVAITARVALAKFLLKQQGLLDAWKEGDSLRPQVFEVIAKCALSLEGGRSEV